MTPLEAILTGPAGEWNAKMFGATTPYPEVSRPVGTRDEIEAHAERLHAAALAGLTGAEPEELCELATAVRALCTG